MLKWTERYTETHRGLPKRHFSTKMTIKTFHPALMDRIRTVGCLLHILYIWLYSAKAGSISLPPFLAWYESEEPGLTIWRETNWSGVGPILYVWKFGLTSHGTSGNWRCLPKFVHKIRCRLKAQTLRSVRCY